MGTMSVPRTLCLTLEVANVEYLFFVFGQKETGAERVAMAIALRVSFWFFVMHIYGANFQEHCFKTKNDVSKRKALFFCIMKGLSNKQKLFFMSYTFQT